MKNFEQYIDREKSTKTSKVTITHYKFSLENNNSLFVTSNDSIYLIINMNHILLINYHQYQTFCPSKHALFGTGINLEISVNKANKYEFVILELSKEYSNVIKKELIEHLPQEFTHIIKNDYLFSFGINTVILDLVKDIETCVNSDSLIRTLETDAIFYNLLIKVFKSIFFDLNKFNFSTTTIYTQYYRVLKDIFDNSSTLQETLKKYRLSEVTFLDLFDKFNPTQSLDNYLNNYKK